VGDISAIDRQVDSRGHLGLGRGADAVLRNEISGVVHGHAVQVQSIHGDVYFGAVPAERMPAPCQLPAAPVTFTGRSRELAALRQVVADGIPEATRLAVVAGAGGAGKTSLVSYWLHQMRGRFEGGQFYADLGGHQPGGPVSPGDVLGGFLRALGVAPERVPVSLAEQSALWRSLTAGQRVIVFLDNAASAAQVRALLPGAGPNLVAVTTRRRLPGLAMDGARFVLLGPLEQADAVELLDRVAGAGRTSSDPEAAQAVVTLCGRLPLAVCVSAARLAAHPDWPVSRVAGELALERHRLAALSIEEDMSVRAAFDVSYRALGSEAARLYRLAALIPGADFCPGLAAAGTATDPERVSDLLGVLADASLLEETADQRFGFHDLVRLHARELAAGEPPGEQRAVVTRSVQWYLRRAVDADLVVISGRWRLGPVYGQARQTGPAYAGPAQALAWLETQLPGLAAAVRAAHDQQLHEEAWQLCEALWGLFAFRKHFGLWIELHLLGIASAQACGNRRAEARMHAQLGLAYRQLGRHGQAHGEFAAALDLDRAEGHSAGEATALEHLGLTSLSTGNLDKAITLFEEARTIFQRADVPRGVAMMTCHIGEAHRDAGRYQQAAGFLAEASGLSAALGDSYNQARALTGLGQALTGDGKPAQAMAPLDEALTIMTVQGAPYEQARVQVAIALAASQLGHAAQAREQFSRALAIYQELGAPEADPVRCQLEALSADAAGRTDITSDKGEPAA
jgi:tetratricopeptide (TPR) repeat protein